MAEKIPRTIQLAMNGIHIEDSVCLEAGTGAGNMTCYLVEKRAKLVYSVSNNQEHLDCARKRLSNDDAKRAIFIRGDLRELSSLSDQAIDLITAHMLINLLPPVDLFLVFKELSRVARKSALLVVDDYNPFSSQQAGSSPLVERLFRIENAIHYLVEGEPALVWYPSQYVTDLLQLLDWKVESVKLLYDETPWEKELLQEHIDTIKEVCAGINDEGMRKGFLQQALEIFDQIRDDEVIYAGSVYSVKARRK